MWVDVLDKVLVNLDNISFIEKDNWDEDTFGLMVKSEKRELFIPAETEELRDKVYSLLKSRIASVEMKPFGGETK